MTRNGFFTGLDIGTSSIKVLVAELVDGEVNVIGVSNAKSKGVKEELLLILKLLLQQLNQQFPKLKRKLVFLFKSVNVGLPANLLQVEPNTRNDSCYFRYKRNHRSRR